MFFSDWFNTNLMEFSRVEPAYTTKEGCRLIWEGGIDDESKAVTLNKSEFALLVDMLTKNSTGRIQLEDHISTIFVNSDSTQFTLKDNWFEADTLALQKEVLEYAKVPHEPQYVKVHAKIFRPTATPVSEAAKKSRSQASALLQGSILSKNTKYRTTRDLFKVMARRRSVRTFARDKVEDWKIDKILAAADTAPTVGNFQGFKVFYIKNHRVKEALVEAANNQSYVNAPLVLVFCMEPSRIKMNFEPDMLAKFSIQDATLAAGYAQLAASGMSLSSIWIGMIDEKKVMSLLNTDLRPSSILCVGYPQRQKPPKLRKNLRELIRVIE